MRRPLGLLSALAMSVVVLAGACGVPADPEPRALSADEVPYGLLDQAPPSLPSTTSTTSPVARVNVAVYFLLNERLQPLARSVTDPATTGKAVDALLAGPTDEEAVNGIRSAVNPNSQVTSSRPIDGIVTVALSADFAAVPTSEQRLALGQIVFTLTGLPDTGGVLFTVGGIPVGVPLPDGTVTTDPVTRETFPTIAPEQLSEPAAA